MQLLIDIKVKYKLERFHMNKYIIVSLIFITASCSKQNKMSEKRLTEIVKAFSGHLYIHYNRYSKRLRKDNIGKFKNTWPLSPNAHDPHDKKGVAPMKMK